MSTTSSDQIFFIENENNSKFKLLKCTICHEICNTASCCGNVNDCTSLFCEGCLRNWVNNSKQNCPQCQVKITPERIQKDLRMQSLINELKVKCIYCDENKITVAENSKNTNRQKRKLGELSSRSCYWTGQYDTLDVHVKNNCIFHPINCSNPGCDIVIERRLLDNHKKNCDHRLVNCQYCKAYLKAAFLFKHFSETCQSIPSKCKCGENVIKKDLKIHMAEACPFGPVPCPFKDHGCSFKTQRNNYDQHQIDAAQDHAKLLSERLSTIDRERKSFQHQYDRKLMKLEKRMMKMAESATELTNHQIDVKTCNWKFDATFDNGIKYSSSMVYYFNAAGRYLIRFSSEITNNSISFHIAMKESELGYPLYLVDTKVTLVNPTNSIRNVIRKFNISDQRLTFDEMFGWNEFVRKDIKSFIDDENKLMFIVNLKLSLNELLV